MQEPRRSNTTLKRLALGLSALFVGACSDPASMMNDPSVGVMEQGVTAGSNTDICAPAPAAQGTDGDTVYYRYSTAKTWADAKVDCEAMGGRLAVPTSSSSNSAILTLQGGSPMFIGIKQAAGQATPDAGWQTIEGDSLSFINWKSGEPNDSPTAGENGEQNCGRMSHVDGTWSDVPCAGPTGNYVCEFGIQPVGCGAGATCGIASGDTNYRCQCPSGQKYDKTNNACYGGPLAVEVNSLNVDKAASGDVFVNFPIHGTIGLKGTGNTNNVHVTLGLMEKPPSGPNATPQELESLRSCIVANGNIALPGDGSQQFVEVDGIVPPECLGTDPQRLANFFVLIDGVEENTTETNKWLIFNEKEAQNPVNQLCTTIDPVTQQPHTGCVINVTVKPPPGLDIALVDASPDSSVGVLAPDAQPPDIRPGSSEPERPLVVLNAEVAAYGRDFDTPGSETLPGQVDFTYDIKAQPDNANVGWKALNANPDGQHAPLSSLVPGELLEIDARLHPTPEFRTLTSPGGAWAGLQNFQIRACATVPFSEAGDPTVAGPNGTTNNCKIFPISLVAGDYASSAASSYTANKTYSTSWGSSSTLKLSLSAGTTNEFNVSSGASSENSATATVSGFFGSVDVFKAWGDGYAKITNASLDAGFKIFGVSLLNYSKSISSYTYTKNLSYSKEKCLTYSYGVVIASIDIEGCFEASAGLQTTLTISTTSVSAQVRPYISSSISVTASLNLTLYKASLSASITLIGLNTSSSDGVTTTLSFSMPNTSTMTIAFDVYAGIRVSTLDGSIDLVIEALEADWCKKKVWGVTVSYPCWDWDTLAEYNIFSYDGYSFTKTLIDRTLSSYTLTL